MSDWNDDPAMGAEVIISRLEDRVTQLEADLNAVCAYADKLEAKLTAIECGDCEKSMLECECDE